MLRLSAFPPLLCFLAGPVSDFAVAGTPVEAAPPPAAIGPLEESRRERDGNISGILFPHLHLFGVAGGSTVDPARLAAGHHDPRHRGFNFNQGFEPGLSLRAGEHFEAFATGLIAYDRDGSEWNYELEEAFGKIKALPGGFELRGGRYLNRFGRQNAMHPHGWDFVDQHLISGLFLGEDGLATDGGEISWNLPVPFTSIVSMSYGKVKTHDHDHGNEHGGHKEEEADFEGEGALFSNEVFSARWLVRHAINDFHQLSGGLSWAGGDNAWDRRTNIFGADFEYLWRENGLEPGGKALRWNTEIFVRRAGAVSGHLHGEEEHGVHDTEPHEHEHEEESRRRTFTQAGFATAAVWTLAPRLDLALRGEWVEGVREAGLRDRWRLSPAVTWRPDDKRRPQLRLQYNYDRGGGFGEAHSVWLQFGVNFGGAEVR